MCSRNFITPCKAVRLFNGHSRINISGSALWRRCLLHQIDDTSSKIAFRGLSSAPTTIAQPYKDINLDVDLTKNLPPPGLQNFPLYGERHKEPFARRDQIQSGAKRVVIKIGSAVITRDYECGVALGYLASIVEQVAEMYKQGREVLIVTSGAIAFGKQKLKQEINSFKTLFDIYNRHTGGLNHSLGQTFPHLTHDTLDNEASIKNNVPSFNSINVNPLKVNTLTEKGVNIGNNGVTTNVFNNIDSRAFAALGQSGLMALYDAMFAQYGIKTAQVLLTEPDFNDKYCRENLRSTIQELLTLKICPIINANDAIAPPPRMDADIAGVISVKDNDIVATHLSVDVKADLLVIMSDVEGIYSTPPAFSPSKPNIITNGARLLDIFCPTIHNMQIKLGQKSRLGTGGMESKIKAATYALKNGCSVIICNGTERNALQNIVKGERVGTFFVQHHVDPSLAENSQQNIAVSVEKLAERARTGSRKLTQLTADERQQILFKIAHSLAQNQEEILEANRKDLELATLNNTSKHLIDRLKLTPQKLENLSAGINEIAKNNSSDVGKTLSKMQIANGMLLRKISVPIGVLFIIFESRPDSLPQIASLSLATCNGLLLKGGKEAKNSNECLYGLIKTILAQYGCSDAISLINTREDIDNLLRLKDKIDLIIPRGSNELVTQIQQMSQGIPVLGHSEGICHVYLDQDADLQMALKIIRDSKCDYPSACNAMETLLIHKALIRPKFFDQIVHMLKNEQVKIYFGPRISDYLKCVENLILPPRINDYNEDQKTPLFKEYGALECSIEMVENMDEAIKHIHEYGSSHTDAIVTDNETSAQNFLSQVDSACVFHNASTRFADGYRFGLGAEVGISTSRIHARGPVGAEGLLTTKWILEGNGNSVSDFNEPNATSTYLHQKIL